MTVLAAFEAGWSPPAAGLYFNGLELLAEAERGGSTAELARVIGAAREAVVARREAALARVDAAAAAVRALGLPAIGAPADAGSFGDWAEAVFESVSSGLAAGSAESVAHLLGFVMGEAVATLDAISLLARLREVAPADTLWMRAQADSLDQERATAQRRLGKLASHPLLADGAQAAAATAAHAVTGQAAGAAAAAVAEQAERARAALAG